MLIKKNDNREPCEEITKTKYVIYFETCSESYLICNDCLKPVYFRCGIETFNEDADGMDKNWRCV